MSDLILTRNYSIPAMSDAAIARVGEFESYALKLPQIEIETFHTFHAGMYARTIMIPDGVVLTGALIKIATVLIVSGYVTAYMGNQKVELRGYHVLPASAHRKQAFIAHRDTYLTMLFPTNAKTIEEAENEFTNEADKLISRKDK